MTYDVTRKTRIPPATGLAAGLGATWVVTDDRRLLRITRGANVAIPALDLDDDALAPTVGAGSVWLIVRRRTGEVWRVDPRSNETRIIQSVGRHPLDLAVANDSDYVWAVDSTGELVLINPNIELAVAKIATGATIESAIAVGGGSVWVAVQE